jgi:hypothetical protein
VEEEEDEEDDDGWDRDDDDEGDEDLETPFSCTVAVHLRHVAGGDVVRCGKGKGPVFDPRLISAHAHCIALGG